MSDRRRQRSALLIVLLSLAACVGTVERDESTLDPRFAGPCDRLTLTWRVKPQAVASLARSKFPAAQGDSGTREVRLRWVRCDGASRRTPPLIYAYLATPVDADEVPLVVTSVPDDGWSATHSVFGDEVATSVLGAMGYAVTPARLVLNVEESGAVNVITAVIEASSGSINVSGSVGAERTLIDQYRGLLTEDAIAAAAFFGEEKAERSALAVNVDWTDTFPLEWDLHGAPHDAVIDRNIRFDRIYWRLPKPSP